MPRVRCTLAAFLLAALVAGQALPGPAEYLVLDALGQGGRSAVFVDPVAARLARGTWRTPTAGDAVEAAGGRNAAWRTVRAAPDGSFEDPALRGGWALARVASEADRIVLLAARGHRAVFVDGEPRAGDPYDLGSVRLPVLLRAGTTELLFQGSRGRLAVTFVPPPAEAYLDDLDATLPDVLSGEPRELFAGILAGNASLAWRRACTIEALVDGAARTTAPFDLPPLSRRKVAVVLPPIDAPPGTRVAVALRLRDADGRVLHESSVQLEARDPGGLHRRTFLSRIDGSVQYYAVRPATGASPEPRGLVLTLHGAGVEASAQAACYAAKEWAHVVAPTNRRPYGFDWEDWGRIDALEVLAHARATFAVDPARVYLTGHSMGGHGTWNVGVHCAPMFAAIAPSAGWCDFWTYGRRAPAPEDDIARVLARAANPSRTLLALANLAGLGVYVLHGDADRNVPVREARAMRAELAKFHPDFAYREQPGADHWWGDACVDWPPLVEFLRTRARPDPEARDTIRFTCVSPGVHATMAWATIEAQESALLPSRIELTRDRARSALRGSTENVARLSVDLRGLLPESGAPASCTVALDGQTFDAPWPGDGVLRLARTGRAWRAVEAFDPHGKGPRRYGPFKTAFDHRAVLVVGTRGDAAENAWALAKARFDAETFWYRGNGAFEVVLDTDFDPAAEPDRSVVLYGNADTNAAWRTLLADAPLDVRRGNLRVGERAIDGDDLTCLFVQPRPGSAVATVAAVAGTGLPGMRAADLAPYFVSGAGFPDWLVFRTAMLERGAEGVLGAGFFALDWQLGESVWR